MISFADPPIVTLRLGSTLSDNIKEGDDVYFECLAVANPQWRKLYWLHDVSTIFLYSYIFFPCFSLLPIFFLFCSFARFAHSIFYFITFIA